jgi:putative ABC transport system substrate-binding protein
MPEGPFVKKIFALLILITLLFLNCKTGEEDLYTIGIFQVDSAPHLNSVRLGFLRALEEAGLKNGVNIRLIIRNGMGNIPEVQRIAQEFVSYRVDLVVPISTPCLQAALHASSEIPIVFSSVAAPFLAGAGHSADDHLPNVTGVSSRGPIKECLIFMKEVLPGVKRIGTLWTPSELNSKYYLDLTMERAAELGLDVVAVPVHNKAGVLIAAQVLMNKKIDAIYQISDNTINASFEAVSRVADENSIPLFGGAVYHTRGGACAAMGWDFADMGYKTGSIAIRIKNGESPADIPIQYMTDIKLYLNLNAAREQGVVFPEWAFDRADEILGTEEKSQQDSTTL